MKLQTELKIVLSSRINKLLCKSKRTENPLFILFQILLDNHVTSYMQHNIHQKGELLFSIIEWIKRPLQKKGERPYIIRLLAGTFNQSTLI